MTLEKVTGKGFKAKILGKEYLVQFQVRNFIALKKRFNIEIPKEELEFYQSHIRIRPVGKFFLEIFYNRFFHD